MMRTGWRQQHKGKQVVLALLLFKMVIMAANAARSCLKIGFASTRLPFSRAVCTAVHGTSFLFPSRSRVLRFSSTEDSNQGRPPYAAGDTGDESTGSESKISIVSKASSKKNKKGGKEKAEMFRLDRLLANRGVGTRTEVTALVRRGKIALDNKKVVKDPSFHVRSDAVLLVDHVPVHPLPLLVVYHKPFGVHSTMGDPMGRPNLEDVLPPRLAKTFHPVGRLDADTTGLLLFSRDGQLTQRLLHPSSNVQREYLATVDIDVGVNENEEEKKRKEADFGAALRAKLAAGVKTADGIYEARLLEVMHRKKIEERDDEVNSIEEEKGAEGRKSNAREELVLRVGVSEGKHRMVRRLLANAGYPVVALHRVRYGHISLGTLSEGEVTEIKAQSEGGQWARRLLGS